MIVQIDVYVQDGLLMSEYRYRAEHTASFSD